MVFVMCGGAEYSGVSWRFLDLERDSDQLTCLTSHFSWGIGMEGEEEEGV